MTCMLFCRIQENDTLRREQERATSPEDVQVLHEEMIVCKLREAESSMMMKQLENELFEIQRLWQVGPANITVSHF